MRNARTEPVAGGGAESGRTVPGGAMPGRTERGRVEPAARGRTVIADRVVERIATRAAVEPGQVTGPGGGLAGLRGSDVRPRVAASVRGRVATVRVALGVTYPAPVRTLTRRVREQVRARVYEMTGIDVRQVDIAVTRLPGEAERGRVA